MTARKEDREDVEDFFEDILGFNFRSFRTLRDLVIRPGTVFAAYAARDRETYTPSLRLWLGIIGIQLLFAVLWGGYGGLLLEQWRTNPDQLALIENAMGAPGEVIARHYGDAASLLHPILVGGMTAFSAFLIGAYNRSLHWTARINITFGILSVASVLGLALLIAGALTRHIELMIWTVPLIALMYWLTFTLGAPGILAATRTGAILKGALFSVVAIALVLVGGVIMTLIGFVYAAIQINAG